LCKKGVPRTPPKKLLHLGAAPVGRRTKSETTAADSKFFLSDRCSGHPHPDLKNFQSRNSAMEKNEKVVLDAMKKAGKPVRPGDVAKALELDSKEVSKIIDSLKKKGLVMSPKRCYYAPSDS